MLQGNKASVYIDGELLGEEEALSTDGRPIDVADFCFGACDFDDDESSTKKKPSKKPRVMVKNFFLYNRPLNSTAMTAIKERKPVPKRAPEPQVKIAPKPAAPAVSVVPGPEKNSAAPAVP
ncbi:trans-sialidase [Trypanosoma cruzi]|nr:trans-sialidase [Trypanosoma cruzi]